MHKLAGTVLSDLEERKAERDEIVKWLSDFKELIVYLSRTDGHVDLQHKNEKLILVFVKNRLGCVCGASNNPPGDDYDFIKKVNLLLASDNIELFLNSSGSSNVTIEGLQEFLNKFDLVKMKR